MKMSGIVAVMSGTDDHFRHPPGFVAGVVAAVAFFTRVPVDPRARNVWRLADSVWAFPLVGAGIGIVAASVFFLVQLVGLGDWPAALLSVFASLVLTGALHEDGLADTADGFL